MEKTEVIIEIVKGINKKSYDRVIKDRLHTLLNASTIIYEKQTSQGITLWEEHSGLELTIDSYEDVAVSDEKYIIALEMFVTLAPIED